MILLLLAALIAGPLAAQGTISVACNPATVAPGGTCTASVSYTRGTGPALTMIGLNLILPAGITSPAAPSIGPAATASGKGIDSSLTLLMVGSPLNNNSIQDGVLVTFQLATGATPGVYALGLGDQVNLISPPGLSQVPNPLGVDALAGVAVNLLSIPGSITVTAPLSRYDANKDGKVDLTDYNQVRDARLGRRPCTSAEDVNGDGRCNQADVNLVSRAVQGSIPL